MSCLTVCSAIICGTSDPCLPLYIYSAHHGLTIKHQYTQAVLNFRRRIIEAFALLDCSNLENRSDGLSRNVDNQLQTYAA